MSVTSTNAASSRVAGNASDRSASVARRHSRLELVPLLHYTSGVTPESAAAAARLRLAFDLFEAGEAMMRATLRRRNPDASAEQIEDELRRWLQHRPGAEHGDGVGVPGRWPRSR